MIDTTKPIEYLGSRESTFPVKAHFIGFNHQGNLVAQISGSSQSNYYTFNKDGGGTFSPDHSIRNVKTKLYYKTIKYSSEVICFVSGEPLEKPLPDYYKNFTVVDTFEREAEL